MTQEFGKYTILRHLADGGMATIWVAEQNGPEGFARYIAIKRLLPEFSKENALREMFLDEARLASLLSHPHIGQIYELGEAKGEHYIAMEFIDGLSLEEVINGYEANGPIPIDLAARVIASILDALEYAHRATDRDGAPLNIVHRDVTPSNILVSNDGIAKLVDFGVAKAAKHRSATQSGAVKGKYAYMSPEQIEGQTVGPQSDVFSLGITFFELLTGVKPFGKELPAVSAILRNPTPDPREFRPDIPESYARIIQKALEKQTEHRYQSARSMLLDIETTLRQRNAYITPLEISVYVRTLRGLEIDVDASHEVDAGLFSADRSGETLISAYALETATAPAPKKPEGLTQLPFKYLAFMIPGSILGLAAMVLIAVLSSGSKTTSSQIPRGASFILSEEAIVQADAVPTALFKKDGNWVVIDSQPEAKLYHVGVFIGTTPFYTRLTPGFYKVELEQGEVRKRATVEVKDAPLTRELFVLQDLDDAPKKSNRKKR